MQSLDDDMDELFRQAASRYPLKTDSDNWDSVLSKMEEKPKPQSASSTGRYRRMLWLLMLIPIGWVCNNYFGEDENERSRPLSQISKPPSAHAETPVTYIDKSPAPGSSKSLYHVKKKEKDPSPGIGLISLKYNPRGSKKVSLFTKEYIEDATPGRFTYMPGSKLFLQTPGLLPVEYITPRNAIPLKKNEPSVLTPDSFMPSAERKSQRSKPAKFFIGFLAGPDISTIKFQKITHTGFNVGVIAGYRLTNKLSLQSGIIFNKKTYYTDGSYFSTKKLDIPPNYYIKTVDGNCRMYEVPVIASYALSSKHNTGLSINAGLSSYIMKGEKYDYFVEHDGYAYNKKVSYSNSSVHLLSAVIGGITIRNKVSKGTMLNLEPYLKIPLKGVGTGKLPITSGGINISLTKDLF